ncbi:MAG: class I SAM-dependent methyltransferase [Thiotrichales bacterium]|nr:class I SAM-dependent methyltransferase [Thiotrichales bacterium]
MEEGQISKTADVAAAIRASHCMYDSNVIFNDPYAINLTSFGWRFICKNRFFHWLVIRRFMKKLKPVSGQTLSRANYAETCLINAIERGIRHYGILSAGLDSFVFRRSDLMNELRVSEFDYPSTQKMKKSRIAEAKFKLPHTHEFVSVDFERESFTDALNKSSIDVNEPVFFSWLGTIPYLTKEAILNSFFELSEFLPQGSQIVFDYAIPDHLLGSPELSAIRELRSFTEKRGEPLVSFLEPEWFLRKLTEMGYKVVEHLDYFDQNNLYFSEREDGYCALPNTNFVLLEI